MGQRTKEASRHVEAVLRALDILDCFQESSEMPVKAIIDRTGLTRSRVMRLLGTLESRGYLIENADTHHYHPGIKLALLGRSFQNYNNIEIITRPVLKKLAMETGESATFYIVDGSERVALFREEGTHAIRFTVREGQRMPMTAGASAKVLRAFASPEILKQMVPVSNSEQETFLTSIEQVRKNGYAVSKGENISDAHAIAAPVFSFKNSLAGALGIAGPASRMDDRKIKNRVKLIVEAAAMLSRLLGDRQKSE